MGTFSVGFAFALSFLVFYPKMTRGLFTPFNLLPLLLNSTPVGSPATGSTYFGP